MYRFWYEAWISILHRGRETLEWKHLWCFHVINLFILLSSHSWPELLMILIKLPFLESSYSLCWINQNKYEPMNKKKKVNHKYMTITIILPSFCLLSFVWTRTSNWGCKIWIIAPLILQPYFTWTWNIAATVGKRIYNHNFYGFVPKQFWWSVQQIPPLSTELFQFKLALLTRSERRFLFLETVKCLELRPGVWGCSDALPCRVFWCCWWIMELDHKW